MIDLTKARRLPEWRAFRKAIESTVLDILGYLPKERLDPQVKVVDELQFPGYVRKRINYFVSEWDRIAAWLFVPEGKDEQPAILCCHEAVPQGKDETAGLEGDPMLALALHYAESGYVTLAPDCVTAGDRVPHGLEAYDTSFVYKDYPRMSAMGKMLSDHRYAIDVLSELKCVDNSRIGAIGHGLGGHNALFLEAFDERVQAGVVSCGFTRFTDDSDPERWARESGFVYLPRLREAIRQRKFPFEWEHLLTLAAPSPTLVITALNDACFPNTESCEKAVTLARNVYDLLGAPDALNIIAHNDGHRMVPETLQAADDWFERWL